jgi:lysophospholipase L1-like esterase
MKNSNLYKKIVLFICVSYVFTPMNSIGEVIVPVISLLLSGESNNSAIKFIANYAQNGGDAPGISMYNTAGIEKISSGSIDRINIAMSSVQKQEADTEAEIQAIVDAITDVHEDAEDGDIGEWFTYATPGTITNVQEHGGRAMSFQGNDGLNNGFALTDLDISSGFMASWSMKYSDDFRFFVRVRTSNLGATVFLEYTPENINRGHSTVGSNTFLHNGLGKGVNDGTWKTFTRNVKTDLERLLPDDTLEAIVGFSVRGSGLVDDIITFEPAPMWAIGDSTVAEYPDTRGDRRGGWAEMLYKQTLYGGPIFDFARPADSSRTFYEKDNDYDGKNFWYDQLDLNNQGAKAHIASITSDVIGGFLFIQFGHNDGNFGTANDTFANFDAEQFGDYITRYVTEAKSLNVIPVLITPVTYLSVANNDSENLHQYDNMDGNGGVGDYPQIMKTVSTNENVLLLDLTQKSYDYYRAHFTSDAALEDAYGSDSVHTNQLGATQVSKLIKELACEYQGAYVSDARLLCKLFRNDVSADIITHEDAQEIQSPPDDWSFFSNSEGSTVTNVLEHNGRAIELSGNNGIGNGFTYTTFPVTSGFIVSWSMKYDEDFRFFVEARTTDFEENTVLFEYTPDTSNLEFTSSDSYRLIKNGLGDNADDNTWHTYARDIEADLKTLFPDDTITEIRAFHVRSSGLVDDITTSARPAAEEFYFNGHRYKIVKTAISWGDASLAAQNDNGYLANIGSITENHEIYSRLNRYIAESEYDNTTSASGGGAAYVWIGAMDSNAEGIWRWSNNNQHFWTGLSDGTPVAGQYNSWGHRSGNNGAQREPDDSGHQQDHAAIALTEWQIGSGNLGQASEWNDLNEGNLLYYIIEYD